VSYDGTGAAGQPEGNPPVPNLQDKKGIDSLMKFALFLLTLSTLAQAEILLQTGFESPAY
jgi:hypothetical protein